MAEPFLGEIKMFGGNFAPRSYSFCNGQLVSIAQNTALFSLLGTTFGGDGQTTFGLPDLRGRVPIHQGQGPGLSPYVMGQVSGAETVTLLSSQLPAHNHTVTCSTGGGNAVAPANNFWASEPNAEAASFSNAAANTAMSPAAIGLSGGGQAHDNMAPFLCLSFIIAVEGVFPSRN